ncbi:MAG TPA: thioredoxin [Candidatus Gemmiger excrementigallinarum]|uniref:Thioredoxin n=1 Tax=Candidatus Gemmiger excrementigallinarum TaxID=2838609 RepID=A0A9D2ESF5_9FIRM|nr:thioredoxin [uncultured Subdoligranulum sp.]HIZ42631.1 thioredoxin [Candidatus Gemmiger excrementigallinarum]
MSVLHITKENFNAEVVNSDRPVLLDFWATWCGPCRMVGPLVEEIAAEHPEIKVGKINVDEQPELAAQFQIMSIPTLMVVKNGQITQRVVGARPKAQILALVQEG